MIVEIGAYSLALALALSLAQALLSGLNRARVCRRAGPVLKQTPDIFYG